MISVKNINYRILSGIIITLAISLCSSCNSYKPYTGSPQAVIVGKKYHFDLKNGKEFIQTIDSVGTSAYYYTKGNKLKLVAFSDIKKIEKGKFSTGRTLGLSGLIALGAAAVTAFIVFVTLW